MNGQPTQYKWRVLLREALSSQDSAFAKLMRSGDPDLTANDNDLESTEVMTSKARPYRMHRKLSPGDLKDLCASYEAGESIVKLAEKFECHRHTVARQLEKAGVQIRPQRKMTADLVAQAAALYANDHTLEDIARLLGLEASTIGKALKRAGVTLRPPVADRWHGLPAE